MQPRSSFSSTDTSSLSAHHNSYDNCHHSIVNRDDTQCVSKHALASGEHTRDADNDD